MRSHSNDRALAKTRGDAVRAADSGVRATRMSPLRSLPALAAAIVIGGCAQYAEVRATRTRLLPYAPGTGILAKAEQAFAKARQASRGQRLAALGSYLEALDIASRELHRNPGNAAAVRAYNFALHRVFEIVRDAPLDPWTKPLRVPAANGEYVLTHAPDPRPEWNPSLYEFTPTDELRIRGTYMKERVTKAGLGAALVARRREVRHDARAEFIPDRPYYGVTALAKFEGRRCVISFVDPLATDQVSVEGRRFPLAADFSAPLAVMLADARPKKLELAWLLRPEKYAETARIARLQPYDPNKTVVLCVHGLADTPATWAPLLNAMRADADIRRHYQFWFYNYPSGYPFPYSAAIMREKLDAVERRFTLRKPMVLIGHSMGGCISRLMITDSGDKIWLGTFGKPPGQLPLSTQSREAFTKSLIFRHRSEVGRAIFIATPHRGSDLAGQWFGRLASSLVRAPTLLLIGQEVRGLVTPDPAGLRLNRIGNSVDTLAPNNRFVKLLKTIPITPGIPYHSIVGDRGKGDTPNSSDGVVPYWSSHMAGAQSELIVPSNHNAHQNPQAIAEVRRILKLGAR